jgi:hypothetical protein
MEKTATGAAPFWVVLVLLVASLACSNPIQGYLATRASGRETATAGMFTLTATETNTRRPTRTSTPSATASPSRTKTNTLVPSDTLFPSDTPTVGSGTVPPPGMGIVTKTGAPSLTGTRFVETAGLTKFSYIPPSGWLEEPSSGGNLTRWNLPTQKGSMACTLAFNIYKSNSTSSEYAKEMLKGVSSTKGMRIISQGKFINDAGLDAYKFVLVLSAQGSNVQMGVYLFQNRGYVILGGYARMVDEYKEQDAVVDASLKTLRYE